MKLPRRAEFFLSMPPLIWLTLLFLIPTVMVVSLSFRPADMYGGVQEGWSLTTIQGLFTSYFWKLSWRTLWISSIATLLSISLALPVAYTIARANDRWRNLLLLLIILPFWSSFIIRIFAWKTLLHPEGQFKQLLVWLHLIQPDAILLYSSISVVSVMVYSYLPFAILPLYAAASNFDFSLCEAAMDLGLSQGKTFWRIFVPGVRAGIATAVLMVFIPAVGAYVIPDVVGGTSSEMLGNRIVQKTLIERNIPEACALSTLLSLAVLLPLSVTALVRQRGLKLVGRNKE